MKLFLIADSHFGKHPLELNKWKKIMKDYFYNFFFPLVEERKEEDDLILHLGDFFDNRDHIDVSIMNLGMDIMEKMSSILPVKIILGNHDLYTLETNNIHSLRWCHYLKNVELIEDVKKMELNGKNCLFAPWISKERSFEEILNTHRNVDYLFCHADLQGARNNKYKIIEHGSTIDQFSHVGQVWSGHIHIRQAIQNFQFVGSPYHLDRNDKGNQKGIYILDLQKGEYEFVENNYSPQYQDFHIKNEKDMESLNDSKMNWLDVKIDTDVLVDNPDLYPKLEKAIEEGKFASFEINEKEKNEEHEIEDIDMENMDVELNIEKLAYKELQNSIDNDAIREKMKNTLNKIIKKHDEEY